MKKYEFSGEIKLKNIPNNKPKFDKAKAIAEMEMKKKKRESLLLEIHKLGDGFHYISPPRTDSYDIMMALEEYFKDDLLEYKTREAAQYAIDEFCSQCIAYVNEAMGELDEDKYQEQEVTRSKKMIGTVWADQCKEELPRAIKAIHNGEDYVEIAKERHVQPMVTLWALDEALKEVYDDYHKIKAENELMRAELEKDKAFKDSQIESLKVTNNRLNKEIMALEHRLKEMENVNLGWEGHQK